MEEKGSNVTVKGLWWVFVVRGDLNVFPQTPKAFPISVGVAVFGSSDATCDRLTLAALRLSADLKAVSLALSSL